jgi:hypothetical protein
MPQYVKSYCGTDVPRLLGTYWIAHTCAFRLRQKVYLLQVHVMLTPVASGQVYLPSHFDMVGIF